LRDGPANRAANGTARRIGFVSTPINGYDPGSGNGVEFMGSLRILCFAAVAFVAAPALGDDPRDPAMTPEAIARDSATIRRLNREQLDYVQRRDAGYAQGWHAYRGEGYQATDEEPAYTADRREDAAMQADYAAQRREYQRALRDWREDVAACRDGYYERCDRR
jgi:hypothetical protein